MQLCIHAFNALAGRRLLDPDKIHRYLASRSIPPKERPEDEARYQGGGPYSPNAILHYIYEHSDTQITLTPIIDLARNMTQTEILQYAPNGCRSLYLHFEYKGSSSGPGVSHYKAWLLADNGHWYEADSITYAQHQNRIKQLAPSDWLDFQGAIYCPIVADAYLTNTTCIRPHPVNSSVHAFESLTTVGEPEPDDSAP